GVHGDADAGVRADRLVGRVPVGGLHRRLERADRDLAVGLAVGRERLLLPRPRSERGRSVAAAPGPALTVRLRDARLAGFAAAGGRNRHRRVPRAVGGLRHRGDRGWRRGFALRLLQGQHFPRRAVDRTLGGCARDGAARRRPGGHRPDRGGRRLHLAAGCARARDPVLAGPPGRRDPPAGAALSRRDRRRDPRAPDARGGRAMNAANREPVLEVRGLRKAFGGVIAVDDVGFEVAAGEIVALIGPNGAGKSTCFNMLMGQLVPDAGAIRILGRETVGMAPRRIWRLGVGRTFQVTATFGSMTVRENVQVALLSHHRGLRDFWRVARERFVEQADALLATVGMGDHAERPCSILAYGDLKRLELAVALANEPRLLLMDEPTAGMGPR